MKNTVKETKVICLRALGRLYNLDIQNYEKTHQFIKKTRPCPDDVIDIPGGGQKEPLWKLKLMK